MHIYIYGLYTFITEADNRTSCQNSVPCNWTWSMKCCHLPNTLVFFTFFRRIKVKLKLVKRFVSVKRCTESLCSLDEITLCNVTHLGHQSEILFISVIIWIHIAKWQIVIFYSLITEGGRHQDRKDHFKWYGANVTIWWCLITVYMQQLRFNLCQLV